MDNFSRTYLKILEEATLTSFSELNSKDFSKSNGNFPEGEDLDITNEFSEFLTDSIHKIILLNHCIRSETETDVHGIDYMNITKERFIEVVSKCLNHIINRHPLFREQDVTFYINDLKIRQEYAVVITFKPLEIQDEYEVILKTIFYSKFKNEEKEKIRHSDKGWWKRTLDIPMIVESRQVLAFYLTVL